MCCIDRRKFDFMEAGESHKRHYRISLSRSIGFKPSDLTQEDADYYL